MQKSVLIGFVGALILVLAVSLKVSAEPVWSTDILASTQVSEPAQQTVDRSHKGDQTSVSARSRNAAYAKLRSISSPPAPALIEGCEPVVSGILATPLAQVAGSCQT